jgi:hypothetical protein
VGEVNIEDAKVSDDTADTGRAGQGELAVLDNLGVTLLVGVLLEITKLDLNNQVERCIRNIP